VPIWTPLNFEFGFACKSDDPESLFSNSATAGAVARANFANSRLE
jgi:hypothetical protein